MSEEMTEVAEGTDTVVVEKKEPKPIRIVDMEDGTRVNFGVRANVLSFLDVPANTVTFKVITGKIIPWVFTGLEALSDLHRTMVLYAGMEKVKSALTGLKEPEKIVETIQESIAKINNGEFSFRVIGESSGEVALDNWQKAFALVVANQPGTGKEHWNNIDDANVITEVLNVWNAKSASERNAAKRHTYVMMRKAELDAAEGKVEELTL